MAGHVYEISGRGVVRAYRSAKLHNFQDHGRVEHLRALVAYIARRWFK